MSWIKKIKRNSWKQLAFTVNVYVLKSFQDNKNFVVYGLFHETNDLQYSQNIV